MDVAKRHQDQLGRIKGAIQSAHEYFKPNYDRFNEFRRMVFETSLREDDVTLLTNLGKPQLEFNILEAYISRLLGEFSKQEPDILVSADDQNTADPAVLSILEQHLRHTLNDANNSHTKYEVYKDILSGGFSVIKVCTDYANPMSFNQVIKIERVFDPTLCGFDPLAMKSHKGDGRFCFELFPMEKERFQEEYPDVDLTSISFKRNFDGFNWSYLNNKTEFLLVAHYYEKRYKRTKIVQLRNGRVMTMKQYEQMQEQWTDFAQVPAIVGKPRMTEIETIDRYVMIENQILEHVSTDFGHLPLIFVDGNSVLVKTPKNGNVRQVTRPYVYHAKSAQRLKNFAGISLANEIENLIQHKFIIKKEALPEEEEFLEAIKDVQHQSNIVVNAFYNKNPDMPIPEPIREIGKVPAPPEIIQAFQGTDNTIQSILGSYDAALGINNNQLSGIAIVEAATQSNSAAMPYIVGFMQAYQRAAQIYVDLLPKYYTTPRTIPIMDEEGKRSYILINGEGGVNMFYDANALNVVVKAGASFQVQKSRTIMMIKEMMGMSPLFAQFIAEKGINFVLDNMEGRGIEQLKGMVDEWVQEMQKAKQMAEQNAQAQAANNPIAIKGQVEMAKIAQKDKESERRFVANLMELKQKEAETIAELDLAQQNSGVQLAKAQAEIISHQLDTELRKEDQRHRHTKEAVELHHQITTKHPNYRSEAQG